MTCQTKAFTLIVLFLCLVAACCNLSFSTSTAKIAIPSECRVVQHKLGETCVPIEPKRIVSLDPRYLTDHVIALGIKPVGTTASYERGRVYFDGLSAKEVNGIENVGDVYQPSLEKILELKPDLILAIDFAHEHIYKQLSAIAPTVLVEYDKIKFSWKKNFRSIAQFLTKQEKAEEVLTRYNNRVRALQDRLGALLEDMEISVVTYYNGGFGTLFLESAIHQVLADIGISHKIAPVARSQISVEIINQYDADYFFIINSSYRPPSYFLQNPLISSLKAARSNQVYIVGFDSIWNAQGPLGLNKIVDDLFRYLPESK